MQSPYTSVRRHRDGCVHVLKAGGSGPSHLGTPIPLQLNVRWLGGRRRQQQRILLRLTASPYRRHVQRDAAARREPLEELGEARGLVVDLPRVGDGGEGGLELLRAANKYL